MKPTTNDIAPTVYIRNPQTSKVLTINGGFCTSGTDIVLWTNNSNDSQKWFLNNDGTFESVHCPGMVLDIEGSLCSGKFMKIHDKVSNTPSQVWMLQSDSFFEPIQCGNGKALDIRRSNTADGAEIVQYSKHGAWNQKWEVVSAP